MQLLERDIRLKEAAIARLESYLEQAVPKALAKGAKRSARGKRYITSVKIPRSFSKREYYKQTGISYRQIISMVSELAGSAYLVQPNPLIAAMHRRVDLTLNHN